MPLNRSDILILVFIAGLMIFRLIAIGVSPLGLDVEEAQYWQWSTVPDVGYFTKPPMIAWFIGLSTSLFGQTEFGVRAFAPILQAVMAVLMMMIGRSTGHSSVGQWAAVIWMTIPISAIGGFIISTDSPMLLFYLAAILTLSPLARGKRLSIFQSILAGLMLGLAMMSKYAAIYLLAGLLIWWLWHGKSILPLIDKRHETKQNYIPLLAFLLSIIIALLPNLVWNLNHGFVTAKHLGDNANLDQSVLSITRPIEFLISQMGVAGPVIAVLAIGAIWQLRHDHQARFWISISIPALLVVTAQAIRNDANANWAVASWPPLIILLSLYLSGQTAKLKTAAMIGIGINAVLALVILAATMAGSFGLLTPASDPLRRIRAWDLHHQDLSSFTAKYGVDAIVTTRREHIAKMIWHHRHQPIPITLIDHDGVAQNHFEQKFRWSPIPGRTIALINQDALPPQLDQVDWQNISASSQHQISQKRDRHLRFHLGLEK